jgi:hypothetical protein
MAYAALCDTLVPKHQLCTYLNALGSMIMPGVHAGILAV